MLKNKTLEEAGEIKKSAEELALPVKIHCSVLPRCN